MVSIPWLNSDVIVLWSMRHKGVNYRQIGLLLKQPRTEQSMRLEFMKVKNAHDGLRNYLVKRRGTGPELAAADAIAARQSIDWFYGANRYDINVTIEDADDNETVVGDEDFDDEATINDPGEAPPTGQASRTNSTVTMASHDNSTEPRASPANSTETNLSTHQGVVPEKSIRQPSDDVPPIPSLNQEVRERERQLGSPGVEAAHTLYYGINLQRYFHDFHEPLEKFPRGTPPTAPLPPCFSAESGLAQFAPGFRPESASSNSETS